MPPFSVQRIDHVVFRVRDLERRVAHLAEHGVMPHGPASQNFGAEGIGLSIYFSDPDGNSIELKGPAKSGA